MGGYVFYKAVLEDNISKLLIVQEVIVCPNEFAIHKVVKLCLA